ncbi:hypothetical protein MKW92_025546 [Papaver armeniacum]|nr:hypothetical protein MKW92_025546 [Papaver armeniacum]
MVVGAVNVCEFQELAKKVLPKMHYDFFTGGAEDEHTLRENVEAFRRITLRPRVLIDVSRINLSTNILGYNMSSPIMVAAIAFQNLAHSEGEVATAKAAAAANTIMVLSTTSTCTIEEVASSCNGIRFFQLYVYKRRDVSAILVQRAERSGYKAIVLTVETPKLGRRWADIKNKNALHQLNIQVMFMQDGCTQLKNFDGLCQLNWLMCGNGSKLEALASQVLDSSLNWNVWAIKAVEAGVAGIIVSNNGARQLDFVPATISVLEEVVQAVGGRIPVLFDGGIRRGTDVFKALALGAQAVLVGRPVIYGLAAKGQNGVTCVIEMLQDELELTMTLCGCCSVKDITRNHVRTERDRLRSLL